MCSGFGDACISRGCSGHSGHTDRTLYVTRGLFQAIAVRTAASVFQILCQSCVLRRFLHGCFCIVRSARGQAPQIYLYVGPRNISNRSSHQVWLDDGVCSFLLHYCFLFLPYMFLSSCFFLRSVSSPTHYQSAVYH